MTAASILVVDDENDIRSTISEILADEGYRVRVAADADAARRSLAEAAPDLVLLDIWMPDTDGITLLREWTAGGPPAFPVVMLSGHGTVETAVEATRLGAVDFVEKPLSLARLLRTVEKALAARPAVRRGEAARGLPSQRSPFIGRNPVITRLQEAAASVAARTEPLLITGEPGSGRQMLAQWIHAVGERAGGPWVQVEGTALPDDAAAALLLGAATATGVEPGGLERAAGGTLCLTEIGALGEAAARLLVGIAGQRCYTPVGSAQPRPLECRLVATLASRDAPALPAALRNALGVFELHMPALRERGADLPELLRQRIEQLVDDEKLAWRRFGPAALNRLRRYPWPGNLPELDNLVRRLLLDGGTEEIGLAEVEAHLPGPATGAHVPLVEQDLLGLPLREAREQFERAYLGEQLALCGGRVGALAQRVGMERTHLYRKLRQLGIDFRHAADEE